MCKQRAKTQCEIGSDPIGQIAAHFQTGSAQLVQTYLKTHTHNLQRLELPLSPNNTKEIIVDGAVIQIISLIVLGIVHPFFSLFSAIMISAKF